MISLPLREMPVITSFQKDQGENGQGKFLLYIEGKYLLLFCDCCALFVTKNVLSRLWQVAF